MAKKTAASAKSKTGGTSKKPKAGSVEKKPADPERRALAAELQSLIPELDSPGLAFLVNQAKIHLYNMQVDELNKAREAANAAGESSGSAAVKSRAGGKAAAAEMKILGTDSGSSYYLHYGNNSVMFSRNELIHLVKIANGKGTDSEIRERLYNWFERERKDVFATVPMKDKFDSRLKTLAALIKNNFKLRK